MTREGKRNEEKREEKGDDYTRDIEVLESIEKTISAITRELEESIPIPNVETTTVCMCL